MSEKYTKWDAADYLKSVADILLYLNSCFEDDPGDGSLVRAALGDIARASGMTALAKKTGITREGLYKALSDDGNPSFETFIKVIRTLGFEMQVKATG